MAQKTLQVARSEADIDDTVTETFIISNELNSMSVSELESVYESFARGEVDVGTRLPLYRIIWQKIAVPTLGQRIRLLHLVILYQRLERTLDEKNIDIIECCTTHKKLTALIKDVAASNDIPVHGNEPTRRSRKRQVILAVTAVLPFFIDQFVSMLVSPLLKTPDRMTTIIVPSMGRFQTIQDILSTAEFDFDVIITPMTVAWFRSKKHYPGIAAHSPATFNSYLSLAAFRDEFAFLRRELLPAFLWGEIDDALSSFLRTEFDVEMSHSIAVEVEELFSGKLIRSLLYYLMTDDIILKRGCDTLVVNSASVMGRSIMAAGKKHDVELYHVRHSAVTGYTPETPFGSIEFVEGSLAIEHLEGVPFVEETSNFIETGYQYLAEQRTDAHKAFTPREPLDVLIATQPYSDDLRLTVVTEILDGLASYDGEYSVTIKPHPDEDAAFYQQRVDSDSVTVVEGDLQESLDSADLVVVINSNAGLEALIAGVPCITLNFWKPVIREMPYTRRLPVPRLGESAEVREFFESLSHERLTSLQHRQQAALESSFIFDTSAAERMAAHIQRDTG